MYAQMIEQGTHPDAAREIAQKEFLLLAGEDEGPTPEELAIEQEAGQDNQMQALSRMLQAAPPRTMPL